MSMEHFYKRAEVERQEKWREWIDKIPSINFPSDWRVKIIPPFGGALVRFSVATPTAKRVSVYLDVNDSLGYYGSPYWEIYPDAEDNNARFDINEIDQLIEAISKVKDHE